jgi:hypothetical protein
MTCGVTRLPAEDWLGEDKFLNFALPSGKPTPNARGRPEGGSRLAVEPVEILLRGGRDFLTFSARSAVPLFKITTDAMPSC